MSKLFISYRRRDNAHAAGRLYSELRDLLGEKSVFMDVDNIPPGSDFVQVLEQKVSRCRVLLAVIGNGWLSAKDDSGKLRLWNERDFVRIEIGAALTRGIPVVPVLFDGAAMPSANELPPALQHLTRRHAVAISHENFGSDTRKLVQRLKPEISWQSAIKNYFLGSSRKQEINMPSEVVQRIEPVWGGAPAASKLPPTMLVPETEVERFFRELVRPSCGQSVTATQVYEAYANWCEKNLIDPLALPSFGRAFADLGVKKERIAGRVRYLDISIA